MILAISYILIFMLLNSINPFPWRQSRANIGFEVSAFRSEIDSHSHVRQSQLYKTAIYASTIVNCNLRGHWVQRFIVSRSHLENLSMHIDITDRTHLYRIYVWRDIP